MTEKTFRLPDVGEGLTEADIVQWKVQPGDTVAVNDVIVEIETAKSLVELPSPYAGTVSSLLVAEGETVDVGTAIISVTVDGGAGAPKAEEAKAPAAEAEEASAPAAETEAPAASLTGTGPKPDAVRRRLRRPAAADAQVSAKPERIVKPAPVPAPAAEPAPEPVRPTTPETAPAPASSGTAAVSDRVNRLIQRVLAKPPVRKAAKDLGINLADVTATGASGEVTKQDLISYQAQREAERDSAGEFWAPGAGAEDSRIERIPVRGVRRATAKAMVESAFSAPHVSIFVDVDASRTMEFVKRLKTSKDFDGIKVSPLLILAKAVIWAAARNPSVNATWAGEEILVKHFMNLGIAAATPRGLMVPNIKDAHELSLKELAIALNTLAATAREGRTPPADMRGGTLTVTNIGSLGIDTGTPIINPGEVAIVAFGTIKQKPWVVNGEVVPRWITTLGGSFDHRVVDGDLSARFMADVAAILEEPALLLD
ncbi:MULTISPECIES: dihydrolipoamide acetyltransferase family protein [unclassified Arthrobacter]|uniref:dihydrolipoamide acetyltransferase family protein n=1 Tax=unclassified Arthrobacter TaxID=235627 RepID=UPI001E5BF54A|nr:MULTISPECIES: dihydrolipoamide acetyltransferase family protein [unclassified Arthrobacter]MCC9144413.1 2-oxo acid dehydrogenase subunit E2 [Arthrobacter sp. zg-Y919]MDK1275639.1 dihydrolipoamide acetyltransferase family protein [Arthrobacter sp. zg.Y919]WIB02992.1 dihydrolipoamide acetyltransferase family protein [Arthrobacter sp. zg-Y919]